MAAQQQEKIFDSASYPYLLYLPAEYDLRKNWPFILFLHGAGERGRDLEAVIRLGIPKIAEANENFPFIAVSPQCPPDSYWENRKLRDLLEQILLRYNIDRQRLYLTGVSMGGYGTWHLAAEMPETFAAIAPICGGGNPGNACKVKDLPIWAFHGAMDSVVPLSESETMVNAVNECGGHARLTIYPEAGHDSWTTAYDNPELYEWFLQHRKETGTGSADER